MGKIIVFDNLVRPSYEIAGDTEVVRAKQGASSKYPNSIVRNLPVLYRPANLEEVKLRAQQAGDIFRKRLNIKVSGI